MFVIDKRNLKFIISMMRNYNLKIVFLKIILLSASCLITPLLFAQGEDVERATREIDRLDRRRIIEETLSRIPQKPPEEKPPEITPAAKKEERFFLKKINLKGTETFPAEEFFGLLKNYEFKETSLSELNSLCKDIEREYLRRSVIAAVFLPPQEVEYGIVTIQVVEARMGELKIQEHKFFQNDRLNYYWRLHHDEIIRYDKISRSVQMMNKNPDRQVKAALHAGKKPGRTDVILSATSHFPIHLFSSYDQEGATPTGKSRINAGIRYNNFLGLDDSLMLGRSLGRDFNTNYAYHSLPASPDGATLIYGYSLSTAKPSKEFAASRIKSETKNSSITLHQDLYRKEEYQGEVFAGFEAKDKTVTRDTGTANRDRLRVFNFGATRIVRGLGSTTTISPEISQGIRALGASSKDNPLVSRGAESMFTRYNLTVEHKKKLPLNLQANLKFRNQLVSTKLTPQEEFSLGGIDSVRGYPSGDYLADNAGVANADLLIPSFFIPLTWRLPYAKEPLKEQLSLVTFLDYGWGKRRGHVEGERKNVNMAGAGAGLRIKLFDQALVRMEWAIPFGDNPITEVGNSRFHFSVDFQDKLPEEIERIRKMMIEEHIKEWSWYLVNKELARPNSPVRKKLARLLNYARHFQKQERLKEAKEYYEQIASISESLYQQAEDYVRSAVSHQQKIKEYQTQASSQYKEGNFKEAKRLWQKLIEESNIKPRPLILEF